MKEKQKQPASFQPDRILSYFKAEWKVLLAVTISGLIYNVGLLAGRSEKEVSRIYLALDATDVVIDRAIKEGADMLITHHPLLFSAVKKVTDEDFITRRIVKLIQNDISYYAMHTNYDVLGMAELSGKIMDLQNGEVLDVTYTDEEGNPKNR